MNFGPDSLGDANGDRKADFEIALTGVTALNWTHDVLVA